MRDCHLSVEKGSIKVGMLGPENSPWELETD